MKGRSQFLALVALVLALACEDQKLPTGLMAPTGASKIISDGSHGGNPDFFFLPPLVQLKRNNPDFELGKFDNTLKPNLSIEICQLDFKDSDSDNRNSVNSNKRSSERGNSENGNGSDFPPADTKCVAGLPLVKRFAPGEVVLVNLPARRGDFPKQLDPDEWYKGRNLPPDGFYYVLWNTRQSRLDEDKFYRITVLLGTTTLGFADVDPRARGHKWRDSRSGQVIQMVDDVKLPIPFRVEKGALCNGATRCTSVTVTNKSTDGTGVQVVRVDGGLGAIAGASFPDGWLRSGGSCTPETCPQSVVVTISEVPSGESDPFVQRTRTIPCHAGLLHLQQFNKCFKFTTTPTLATIAGRQFAEGVIVTVAVCYRLQGTGDPREKFAELYASGPTEPAHALDDVPENILGAAARNCTTTQPFGLGSSNALTRLASAGWRKVKGGLGQLFGVKTAYAIDGGLGGIVKGFSNIGPVLPARIEVFTSPNVILGPEEVTTTPSVRIFGNHTHGADVTPTTGGIDSVPVTFSVAAGNGTLRALGSVAAGRDSITVTTRGQSFPPEEGLEHGIASVIWTPPTAPNTYHMTASGPTTNGLVEFSVTVPEPPVIGLNVLTVGGWWNPTSGIPNVQIIRFFVDGNAVSVGSYGRCDESAEPALCDWPQTAGNTNRWATHQEISAVFTRPYGTKTVTMKYIPSPLQYGAHLSVTTVTHFTDGSGHADYTTTEVLEIST